MESVQQSSTARDEWRRHWPVVAASTLGYAVSTIHLYSLGVMIAPLEMEFGWSRAEITAGFLIVSVTIFLFSSAVGFLLDRIGPRRIALVGVLVYGLSLAMLSFTHQAITTWWFLWMLVALGALLLKATIWVYAISSLFTASRGLALAVALSASGIVASVAPLLTEILVTEYGWRSAYVIWGAIAVTLGFPILFLFFSSAMEQQRKNRSPHITEQPTHPKIHAPLLKTLRSPAFVKLGAVSAIMSIVIAGLIVGLVPIMISVGIDRTSAAAIAGIVGITQIFGRLTCGYLLDRFDARKISAGVVCFPIVTCLAYILFGGSIPGAIVAVLFFGLTVGAELDAIAYLASRYFGIGNFGALFGTIMSLTALGAGLGPFVSSMTYDITGNYLPVLWAVIPLTLFSGYLLLTLGAYPEDSNSKASD